MTTYRAWHKRFSGLLIWAPWHNNIWGFPSPCFLSLPPAQQHRFPSKSIVHFSSLVMLLSQQEHIHALLPPQAQLQEPAKPLYIQAVSLQCLTYFPQPSTPKVYTWHTLPILPGRAWLQGFPHSCHRRLYGISSACPLSHLIATQEIKWRKRIMNEYEENRDERQTDPDWRAFLHTPMNASLSFMPMAYIYNVVTSV